MKNIDTLSVNVRSLSTREWRCEGAVGSLKVDPFSYVTRQKRQPNGGSSFYFGGGDINAFYDVVVIFEYETKLTMSVCD